MKKIMTGIVLCAIVAQGTGCAATGGPAGEAFANKPCQASGGQRHYRNPFLRERHIASGCSTDVATGERYAASDEESREARPEYRNPFLRERGIRE